MWYDRTIKMLSIFNKRISNVLQNFDDVIYCHVEQFLSEIQNQFNPKLYS